MVAKQPPGTPAGEAAFQYQTSERSDLDTDCPREGSVQSVESEKEKEMLRNPHKTVGGYPCFSV